MSGTLSEPSGFSLPIQVVEAGGLGAWLVEDQSVPVVSIAWSWMGGRRWTRPGRKAPPPWPPPC